MRESAAMALGIRPFTFRPTLSPRGGRWLVALLALLCLLAAARLALLLVAPVGAPDLDFPPATGTAQGAIVLYPGSTGAVADREALPTANLDAEVLGVITRGAEAWANIAVDGAADGIYRPGDELAPGVRVERIEPGLVVVREQGQPRRIPLRTLLAAGAMPLGETPPPAATAMALSPATTAGGEQALRLDALDDVASARGFAAGDLVVAVDDRPLADLLADGEALAALASGAGEYRVRVLRDGGEQEISIDAAEVASWLNRR
ncbi:MAG: hypothetical protein WDA10_12200 [Porticoccaceae bacterium]